jgi:hypothetical protein
MTSQYKYDNLLGDREKNLISILLNKGKTLEYISNRFGLSKKFIRTNLCNPHMVYSICFSSKKIPYYDDEMNYGKLQLNYSFDELNNNEIEAYNNYQLKIESNND